MSGNNFTATGWTNGSGTYGFRVQITDRTGFFKQSWSSVTLRLIGGSRSSTAHPNLTPSFWRKCPELRGKDIRNWLFENSLAPWKYGSPPKFRVSPTDEGEFAVDIID